jgi:hypothetical protein
MAIFGYITAEFPLIGIKPSTILAAETDTSLTMGRLPKIGESVCSWRFSRRGVAIVPELDFLVKNNKRFMAIVTKVFKYNGATFTVNVPGKQFSYYLQFGLLWNGEFFWI